MKYLLDTNVLSELVRPSPDEAVATRFRETEGEVAIASVVWHELLFGLERLAASQRKEQLNGFLWDVVFPNLPILAYEEQAARWHAAERARLGARGRTPGFADGQVAAVAATNELVLVTRNTADFTDFVGLQVERWHSGTAPA